MSAIDHDYIYLQPPCCADEDVGRLWCEDPDPTDCDDGKHWTKYVRSDIYEALRSRVAELEAICENVPEGCTPADARVLREANHALAAEVAQAKWHKDIAEAALASVEQERDELRRQNGELLTESATHVGSGNRAVRRIKAQIQIAIAEAVAPLMAAPGGEAVLPFAVATFDGEGSYDLRLYEGNEKYVDEYRQKNSAKYSDWVMLLYTHPAPAVDDGVVRDAARYRWLCEEIENGAVYGVSGALVELFDDTTYDNGEELSAAIDAAMKEQQDAKSHG